VCPSQMLPSAVSAREITGVWDGSGSQFRAWSSMKWNCALRDGPETSTPSWLSFDRAVIATWTVSDALKLPSFWSLRRSAPCGPDPQFSASIRKQLQYGTFEALAMEAKETGLKLKPSKRIRPLRLQSRGIHLRFAAIAVDGAAGNPGFGNPLFGGTVLRRQTIGIECTCIGDEAR